MHSFLVLRVCRDTTGEQAQVHWFNLNSISDLDEFNSVEEFVLERAWLADKKVVSLGLNEVGIDAEIVKAQVVILPGANEALNDLKYSVVMV